MQTKELRDRANFIFEAYNRHGCCSGGIGMSTGRFSDLNTVIRFWTVFYCVGTVNKVAG